MGVVDIVKICLEIDLMIGGNTPVFNTPVLGAFCKLFEDIPLDEMIDVIKDNFPKASIGELNANGAKLAYERVQN